MKHRFTTIAVFVVALAAAGCTITDTQPPPLSGPSEMSLSLALTASPEVLSLDGASVSRIRVEARDKDGQLLKMENRARLRVEIVADGVATDFGTLSSREIETNGSGQAEVTYTAPMFVSGQIPTLNISFTPTGAYAANDAANHLRRVITIRLVPPGVIGNAPTPSFTFTPSSPGAFQTVRFDGSSSQPGLGAAITSYVWDFGDDTSATGVTATHQYSTPGTYMARLTVTDTNGFSATSTAQAIDVGAGSAPTADFIFSPAAPTLAQTIFFNATSSTPGTGHQIVRYDWDFGDGVRRSGSTVSKAYSTAGTFNVVLTVTDEAGQTGQTIKQVTIGGSPATASFTISPTNPRVGTTLNFNASASKGEGTNTITSYAWDFGCTTGSTCTNSTGSGVTISNTYNTAFTYTVRLTITDSKGKTATTTQSITIAP
jgi:PKD repeat protein